MKQRGLRKPASERRLQEFKVYMILSLFVKKPTAIFLEH